ncbi:MAG TPA: hypothetical protein PLA97_02020 [Rubrivivax sp.]|nr:hypothetical protein [Rubrivivax sp.]
MTQVELGSLLPVFLAVLALLGLGLAAMAVGVIFKRPSLRGSCGGPALHTPQGEPISCATCPNRDKPAHEHGARCQRRH